MHTVVWVLLDLYMLVSRLKKWIDILVTIVHSQLSPLFHWVWWRLIFIVFLSLNILRIRIIGGSGLELTRVQTHLVSTNSCDTQQGQNPVPKTCNRYKYVNCFYVCVYVVRIHMYFMLFHYRVENHSAKDKNTTTMSQGKAKVYIDVIAV